VRRRLTLLVAATTSIILLAFTLPLALLIDRTATSNAVTTAADRSQRIVPVVLSGTDGEIRVAVQAVSDADYRMQVRLPSGQVLGRPLDVDRPAVDPALRATEAHTLADGRVVLDQPVLRPDGTAVVSTLLSEAVLDRGVWRAWGVLALLALLLFVLSLVVADRLARRITAPITDLAATTRRLAGGDLDARVDPAGPPEVHDVGLAVNRLAGRIRDLLAHERESVADLSHRLRTPVTALRLDVEGMPAGPDRDRLTADVDELDRQVGALIRDARRPVGAGHAARCDATEVVRERVEFWQALAEDQGRPVGLSLPPTPCLVRATQPDLEAALDALLGNVLAHTPDGVRFDVTLEPAAGGGAVLVVSDEGPGLPDAMVVARGRSGAGSTGLGLHIARRPAEESGGALATDAPPAGGARVTVRLGPPDPA
jgi:signal transduction histidine kinase